MNSVPDIIVSDIYLKNISNLHNNDQINKDYERSIKEIDLLFEKNNLFMSTKKLNEYKKTILNNLAVEYENIKSDSKNLSVIKKEIISHINDLGVILENILLHNNLFLENFYSLSNQYIYLMIGRPDGFFLTLNHKNENNEIYEFLTVTINLYENTNFFNKKIFDRNSLKIEFNRKYTMCIPEVINANIDYFKYLLYKNNFSEFEKIFLLYNSFLEKNKDLLHSNSIEQYFKGKKISTFNDFNNIFSDFKDYMFLNNDINFN